MFRLLITKKSESGTTAPVCDVTSCCSELTWTTSILYQPGKLNFTLNHTDVGINYPVDCGDVVMFIPCEQTGNNTFSTITPMKNNTQVGFKGIVFNVEYDVNGNTKVLCYDQLRYFQNHDCLTFGPLETKVLDDNGKESTVDTSNTIADFFNLIMERAGFTEYTICEKTTDDINEYNTLNPYATILQNLEQTSDKITLPQKTFYDVSYAEMFKWMTNCGIDAGVEEYFIGNFTELGNWYNIFKDLSSYFYIYDNFGVLTLTRLVDNITDLIVGDDSLLTEYNYTESIDKVINEVIITSTYKKSKEKNGNVDNDKVKFVVDAKQHLDSVKQYGRLRKIINIKNATEMGIVTDDMKDWQKEYNEEKWKSISSDYAELYLKKNDHKEVKVNIKCIGYDGVVAGKTIYLYRNNNIIPMYIRTATHNYSNGIHTMDLQLASEL